jgi:hypothetical protein
MNNQVAVPPSPKSAAALRTVKEENMLLNLLCNVVLPAVILSKLSKETMLGPLWGLVVALAFPLGYGIYDFAVRRKWNFLSIIGFISVSITGGLGLAKADGIWFAVKDGAVPMLFGVAIVGSLWTPTPLIRTLLYNEKVLDTNRVAAALEQRGTKPQFEQIMVRATWMLAGCFFLSAVLNFIAARMIIRSPAGTTEFNAELGKMTVISHSVILVPTFLVLVGALWYLLGGIRRLTGLTLDDIFREQPKAK